MIKCRNGLDDVIVIFLDMGQSTVSEQEVAFRSAHLDAEFDPCPRVGMT